LIYKGGSRVRWVTSKEGERDINISPTGHPLTPFFEEGVRKEKKFWSFNYE
jgi:hypothetical protein